MLDIKEIRKEPEKYRKGLEAKQAGGQLQQLLSLDEKRRKYITKGDELRALRNKVSKEIGTLKQAGKPADAKIKEMRDVGERIKALDDDIKATAAKIDDLMVTLPNIPHESVKVGFTAADNEFVKSWGKPPEYDFPLIDHLDLGEHLGILDFPRAAKISGTGFPLYMGAGARLERALINFMLDFHYEKHQYSEVFPPFLVKREAAFGTGQLPKLAEDMYRTTEDDLFLIPTAEVPVTNIHREEIIPEQQLPLKYTAYSGCFRREAGSYGKETRGLSRVHQFNKVEMVQLTIPDNSYQVLEQILAEAEAVLQALGLHYKVLSLCSGDLSFAAAKCYDLEVWAPASQKFFEVSSVSNFEDFQARRMSIRYRRSRDGKVDFVHTLNGSGLATPRLMIALLETYQTDEKTVVIPEILHPYTGFTMIKKY